MKLISLAPSCTEILYKLNCQTELVGRSSYCDYPPAVAKKESFGGWVNPNIAKIRKMNPDLIFTSDDLQEKTVQKLAKNYKVVHVTPHDLNDVYKSIETIGNSVNRQEEAKKIVNQMKQRLKTVSLNEKIRIYCEEWHKPPMVSGNWIPDLVNKIGGNYFIDEGRSREFSLNKLSNFNPEFIFLNICGKGNDFNKGNLYNRAAWKDLEAFKEENVYVLDDSLLNRPGPRLVKGANRICDIVNSHVS